MATAKFKLKRDMLVEITEDCADYIRNTHGINRVAVQDEFVVEKVATINDAPYALITKPFSEGYAHLEYSVWVYATPHHLKIVFDLS